MEDLFEVVDQALKTKGYKKQEKKSEETVSELGKNYYLELRPYKIKTSYVNLMIKIKVNITNLTETKQEFDNVKRLFQKGKVNIVFDSWLLTDYEDRWGMKPFVYFFKGMVNKWVFQMKMEPGFTAELVGDTAYIFGKIKKLLEKYRKQDVTYVFEKDVMKEVEEDVKRQETPSP